VLRRLRYGTGIQGLPVVLRGMVISSMNLIITSSSEYYAEQKKIYLSKPRSWIWETEAYTIQPNLQVFVVFDRGAALRQLREALCEMIPK
jgi:hypothetical protein